MKGGANRKKGFTLIELIMVIVLIGIVAATAVMVIGNIVTQQQFDATVKEMNELKMSNLGNPDMFQGGTRTSFAFVGDIGGLPAGNSLQPLLVQGALPNWATTAAYHAATYPAEPAIPDLGTGAGWKGPYIDNKRDDSGTYLATLDGWGNAYTYVTATGQVTSTGGGAGNIVIPETSVASQLTGGVTGTVRGNQGNPVEGATVRIYYPNGSGVHTTSAFTTLSDGVYNFTNIPIGRHTIRVQSNTVFMSNVVVIEGNQAQAKDFTIADTVAPNTPTAVTAARATLSNLNLTWTAPADVDLVGYQIDRSLNGATYSLLQTIGVGTSFSDTSLTAGQRYFYRMRAVDKSGNQSADSTVSSTTVSPIRQTVATTWSQPGNGGMTCAATSDVENCGAFVNRQKALFTIQNTGNAADNGANITVNSMVITWGTTGGTVKKILAADTATIRYCSTAGTATGSTTTLTTPLVINAGASTTMGIYFCTTGAKPTFVSVQFNTADGSFSFY